tara:strand:- start:299 stop:742 length:444 start_codon:yes stop_codon:yes gene_type:complete
VISVFLLDRYSKNLIINIELSNGGRIYINDFLNFDLIWNSGIGFGLLNLDASILYHIISLIIITVILVIIYLIVKDDGNEKLYYSLILGGAIGNCYDRIVYYSVPDFIDLHIDDYHWFTFNIADIFITVGIILLIFKEVFIKENEKN